MTVKNLLLIALVLVNLLLVTGVVLHMTAEPAEAQVVGGGFNYAFVTATLTGDTDTLWVLDLRTRKLHALRMPQGANMTMTVMGTRDLTRDFRAGGGR